MELSKLAPRGNPHAGAPRLSTMRRRAQLCGSPQYHPRSARLTAILRARWASCARRSRARRI